MCIYIYIYIYIFIYLFTYIYKLCNSTLEKNGLKPPTLSASYLPQCFLVILQGQKLPPCGHHMLEQPFGPSTTKHNGEDTTVPSCLLANPTSARFHCGRSTVSEAPRGPLGPLGWEWMSSKSMGNGEKSRRKLENPSWFQRRTCLSCIFHCVSEPAKLRKKKNAAILSGRSREWNL